VPRSRGRWAPTGGGPSPRPAAASFAACGREGAACASDGDSCASDGDSCASDGDSCASDGDSCASEGVSCETEGVACETEGVACETEGVACETDGVSCETAGVSCETAGVSCETEGVSCETAGVSCETAGVSCETEGVSCETEGVSCETAGVSCETAGVSCETAGVSCETAGVSCETEGVSCETEGDACGSDGDCEDFPFSTVVSLGWRRHAAGARPTGQPRRVAASFDVAPKRRDVVATRRDVVGRDVAPERTSSLRPKAVRFFPQIAVLGRCATRGRPAPCKEGRGQAGLRAPGSRATRAVHLAAPHVHAVDSRTGAACFWAPRRRRAPGLLQRGSDRHRTQPRNKKIESSSAGDPGRRSPQVNG
jgi:hypothetical protein